MAEVQETKYTGRCPRFGSCSVNACPLDYRIRPTHKHDPEQTCKANLRDRMEVAAQAEADGITLPWAGIRQDEAARIKAGEPIEVIIAEWDAKAEAMRLKGERIGGLRRLAVAKAKGLGKGHISGDAILAVLLIVQTALFWASAGGVLL